MASRNAESRVKDQRYVLSPSERAGPGAMLMRALSALAPIHGHQLGALRCAAGRVGLFAGFGFRGEAGLFSLCGGLLLGLALCGAGGANSFQLGLSGCMAVFEIGVSDGGLGLELGEARLLGFRGDGEPVVVGRYRILQRNEFFKQIGQREPPAAGGDEPLFV